MAGALFLFYSVIHATMAEFIAPVPALVITVDNDKKSPVLSIHRNRQQLLKEVAGSHVVTAQKNLLRRFLLSEIAKETECVNIKDKNRATKCRCMIDARARLCEADTVQAIDFIYGYALCSKMEEQTMLMEWIKYAETVTYAYMRGDPDRRKGFLLPGTSLLICSDALCSLLGIGMDAWATVTKMAKHNIPPPHGLIGHVGNKKDDPMEAILKHYFEEIVKLGQP